MAVENKRGTALEPTSKEFFTCSVRRRTDMPTLNRFPLLGLWAREAATRIGYTAPDADTIGHAYAVLYAIRAQQHDPAP